MTGSTEEILRLPAILDLAEAEKLLATVRQWLQADRPLRIDAAGVETLTLPCIQIILAALRSGARVTIEQPSAAFNGAFRDLGLDWTQGREQGHEQVQGQGTDQIKEQDADCPPIHDQTDQHSMTKRILTIDDSKTMRDMLMVTLADAGFDVLQAVDGQDGLDVLGKERVDVVITDINMPKMDGYEVIRHLRRSPVHKTTPILVLTTESDAEKRDIAREAGATGWMVKPFDPNRLIATIRKVAP